MINKEKREMSENGVQHWVQEDKTLPTPTSTIITSLSLQEMYCIRTPEAILILSRKKLMLISWTTIFIRLNLGSWICLWDLSSTVTAIINLEWPLKTTGLVAFTMPTFQGTACLPHLKVRMFMSGKVKDKYCVECQGTTSDFLRFSTTTQRKVVLQLQTFFLPGGATQAMVPQRTTCGSWNHLLRNGLIYRLPPLCTSILERVSRVTSHSLVRPKLMISFNTHCSFYPERSSTSGLRLYTGGLLV